MDAGETVAHNLGDIQKTSQMLKMQSSIMGANAGSVVRRDGKLDPFSLFALGSVEICQRTPNSRNRT